MLNEEDEQQESHVHEDSKGDDIPEGKILVEERDSSTKSKNIAKKVYECEECGKKFHAQTNLQRHKVVHSGEKPYTCEICGESFPYWTSAKRHRWVHHENTFCEVCGQDFPSRGELKNHIEVHGEDWPIKCELCGKKFTRKDLLQNHIKIHNGKAFKCEKCNKCFSSEEIFNSHKHAQCEEQIFKCDNCGKCFSQKRYLKDHKKRLKCDKADDQIDSPEKPTQTFYEFITEMRNKLDDNHNLRNNMSLYCEVCHKAFSSASDLERHQKSHLKQKVLHKCEECGKSFIAAIRLKRHSRVHRGQNLYECDICKTKFQYKSTLSIHKLDHDKEIGIKCNFCEKYLVRKANLPRHLKLFHSDKSFQVNKNENIEKNISPPKIEKTIDKSVQENKNGNIEKNISPPKMDKTIFNCEVCMKGFNSDRHLKRHSVTHSGETPFKCRICLSEFKFQSSLTKHQVFSHSRNGLDGTRQCSFCNKDFLTEKRLKQHMRMHTEIKLTKEVKAVIEDQNNDMRLHTEISQTKEVKAVIEDQNTDLRLLTEIKLTKEVKPAVQDKNADVNLPPPAHFPVNPEGIPGINVNEHLSYNDNAPPIPDFKVSQSHNERISNNADIPNHDCQNDDHNGEDDDDSKNDDHNGEDDGASSDSCSGQSFVSDEQNFVRSVQTSHQSVISGVRVYFEDGVYCQVSAAELNNLNLNQLNSSPRVVLSSLDPVLQGRSRVLVAVNIVFKDPDSGEVMAVRTADI